MAIKLKAKETLQRVGDYAGQYRFVLNTELYNKLSESKVIQEAALRSGVSKGVMQACWDAAGEVIKAWATEGHSVAIPGLGTMRFGVRAKSVESVDKVASNIITSRRVIFTPNVDIKQELKATSISISCYDRNGVLIKNVTSGDDGDVEDGDDNGGGGNGGGSNTPSGNEGEQTPSGGEGEQTPSGGEGEQTPSGNEGEQTPSGGDSNPDSSTPTSLGVTENADGSTTERFSDGSYIVRYEDDTYMTVDKDGNRVMHY